MRTKLKEVKSLLTGEDKVDIIIIDDYQCEPGFYRHQGKIINEDEKKLLEKRCNRLVCFTSFKEK